MFALLLHQNDMNPGTGLQLHLRKVLLMDNNGLGSTRRGKEVNLGLFQIPKDIKKLGFFLFIFFLNIVLHSILNKRCTVLSCDNETM